jgi:2-(1,2-epoxy-1,2-dihydrophenyl)acetyl-CoA isomerase
MLFLSPRLDAKRAFEAGLVSLVLPNDRFEIEVRDLARRLAEGPTRALGVAKTLMNQAADADRLDAHLDRELTELARIADGADFAEGIDAFFAKRTPRFRGK